MRSTSFRTARTLVLRPACRLGTGVLILGLALTASVRDEGTVEAATRSTESDYHPGTTAVAVLLPPAAVRAGIRTAATLKAKAKTRRWYQIGIASWYGTQFQGRKTAAGERFDMNGMTCAHPTLPMGTWLRVTNLKNRRTTFVRVNDRGPVFEGRIVDLSFAAARSVGLVGVGRVRLDALRDDDTEMAAALMAQVQLPQAFEPMGR